MSGDPAGTILLVEDDDAHAELLVMTLRDLYPALQVARARDGEEATQHLARAGTPGGPPRPRLVLLDLKLPRKSGHQVLAETRRDPALRSVPVVVLTTSDAHADVRRAYDHLANGYLVKPVDFDELVRMLKAVVEFWIDWNVTTDAARSDAWATNGS